MIYEEFKKVILQKINDNLGSEYSFNIRTVLKNNSILLDALNIKKNNESISPNIYLNSYYDEYCLGKDIQEIILSIQNVYYTHKPPNIKNNCFVFEFKWEKMKHNTVFRLVHYNKNKELLSHIPHERFLDLAITYDYIVNIQDNNMATIRITNQHLLELKITKEELKETAYINTSRIFKPHFFHMQDILKNHDQFHLKKNNLIMNIPKENSFDDLFKNIETKDDSMYILSNHIGLNGATCMLYDGLLEKISDFFQTDLYIIPSSIHEVIIIPVIYQMSENGLNSMVKEVNDTQVSIDEVLSDHVYIYKSKIKEIIY